MKIEGGTQRARTYDTVGEIVKVGLKHGDQNALLIKPMKGALKDQEVLMVLDPAVVSENANKITVKGVKSSNGNVMAVGGVMHFQSTTLISERDADQKVLQARWSFKMGVAEEMQPQQAAFLSLPAGQDGRANIAVVRPAKGIVSREETNDGLVAKVMAVVGEANIESPENGGRAESRVYISALTGEGKDAELSLNIVSLLKRVGEAYERRTDDEVLALVKERVQHVDASGEVAIFPGSAAMLSKQAGEFTSDGATIKRNYAVGITNSDILLANGKWEDDDGNEGTFTNRVEESALRLAGLHTNGNKPHNIPDHVIFGRMLGQIEGYPSQDATADTGAEDASAEAPTAEVDDDPFGELDKAAEDDNDQAQGPS